MGPQAALYRRRARPCAEGLSARSGQSEASHVRAALRAYVRAAGQDHGRRPYPFADMAGMYEGGPADLVVNHDHYLYGARKVEP